MAPVSGSPSTLGRGSAERPCSLCSLAAAGLRTTTFSRLGTLSLRQFGAHASRVSGYAWPSGRSLSGLVVAAVKDAADYKWTFSRTYASPEERMEAHSRCHRRSAERVLHALLANGGPCPLAPLSHSVLM
jgi:hypothetical protein